MRAGGDHLLDIRKLQRAVLHLEPREVVVLGCLAIAGDIHLRLREAEDLLTAEKLRLGGVIELSLAHRWQGILRKCCRPQLRNRRSSTGEHSDRKGFLHHGAPR